MPSSSTVLAVLALAALLPSSRAVADVPSFRVGQRTIYSFKGHMVERVAGTSTWGVRFEERVVAVERDRSGATQVTLVRKILDKSGTPPKEDFELTPRPGRLLYRIGKDAVDRREPHEHGWILAWVMRLAPGVKWIPDPRSRDAPSFRDFATVESPEAGDSRRCHRIELPGSVNTHVHETICEREGVVRHAEYRFAGSPTWSAVTQRE